MIVRDTTLTTGITTSVAIVGDSGQGVENVGYMLSPGALKIVALLQTALASAKLRLWQSGLVELGPTTSLADLIAGEATYSGYTAGGATITTFNNPGAVGNGAQTVSPLTQFDFTTPEEDPPVMNTIGGYFLVTSAGVLLQAGAFDDGIPMVDDNSSIPLVVAFQLQTATP